MGYNEVVSEISRKKMKAGKNIDVLLEVFFVCFLVYILVKVSRE